MAGKPVHLEIGANDTQRAVKFYSDLFGWQLQKFEGGPTEYYMTQFSEDSGGAIQEGGPGVRVYFDVDDISAGRARVEELGGKPQEDPQPVPGMGWFVRCTDPEGNEFGIWQSDPNATMG